jgi:hypothetical protein
MAKILTYSQLEISSQVEEIIENILNPKLNESLDDNFVYKVLKGLSADLKFNYGLVFTFGTGI